LKLTLVPTLGTPFSAMYVGREPFARSLDSCHGGDDFISDSSDNLEHHHHHVINSRKRRRLKSSRLNCRHCGDVFTSKVSFSLHQQRHIDDARHRGVHHGEKVVDPSDHDLDDNDFVQDHDLHNDFDEEEEEEEELIAKFKNEPRSKV
jgi:hypothetical protein